jgi:flotillin
MPIPRWGRVVARPHEFLVHIRNGRVITSGQGASCFKWPSDGVAMIPTSIEKLGFSADQVTREKVGVEVTGLAVYRIVEPLLAYRMLDLETSRLSEVLRDMFVGATRRIVASLTLEECIAHRKERVAAALMSEIAPVLAGEGCVEDTTRTGWGVVLDTIEIQDVRVLSEEVFQRLQAPYRDQLALTSMEARAHVQVAEETAARAAMEEEIARAARRQQAEIQRENERVEADLRAAARRAEAAEAHQRRTMELEQENQRRKLELQQRAGELEVELERARREARGEPTEAQLREVMLTQTMPRVAEAFRGSFERVNVTSTGGEGGELFAFLSAGLDTVLRATERRMR